MHTTRYAGVNADDDEYKEPSFYSDDVSNLELEEELLQLLLATCANAFMIV